MQLSAREKNFVHHFGEMGSRWGFNRTVGQMYALLVINEQPLHAEQIAQALSISRGNVSMGIKELQSWRLIQLHHQPGDRKDYFSSVGSIWDMAKRVFEERIKREVEPTLSLLRGNLLDDAETEHEAYALKQMHEIHDLLEMVTQWATSLNSLTPETLESVMKLGTGVTKVLDFKNKLTGAK